VETSSLDIIIKYFSGFTEVQTQQFAALEPLYKDWNEKINVISRKDIEGLYEKHVLHSLSIAAVFDFQDGTEVIDIGTGGGFPGIPLAIFFPQVKFHLVDSIRKKLTIVDEVINELKLKNVTTEHIRVEEIKDRKFDFAVSRAVAPLGELWKWSKPLLKKSVFTIQDQGGVHIFHSGLICLKGGDLSQEISESNTRPNIVPISDLFEEEFFREKYLLYVPV
jgi:16S rRNA (guanine(527)-N(7))-methyltransferase GidB